MECGKGTIRALGLHTQRYGRMVMALTPKEANWQVRRVHIFVDDLLTLELTIWTGSDDDAVAKACKSAHAIIKAIGKQNPALQRYSKEFMKIEVEPAAGAGEDYNGVAVV